jgi:hypothetical protein
LQSCNFQKTQKERQKRPFSGRVGLVKIHPAVVSVNSNQGPSTGKRLAGSSRLASGEHAKPARLSWMKADIRRRDGSGNVKVGETHLN